MSILAGSSFTISDKGEENKISVFQCMVHRPHASELSEILSKDADPLSLGQEPLSESQV